MKLPHGFWLVSLSSILACAITAEVADPNPDLAAPPLRPPTDFRSLDGDGDGRISLAEFTAPAVVRRAERQTQAPRPRNSPDVSASQDGILSSTGSIEGRYSPEVFKNLDVDHDGFLSPVELNVLFDSGHKISQP
jgi:hypothetical protein